MMNFNMQVPETLGVLFWIAQVVLLVLAILGIVGWIVGLIPIIMVGTVWFVMSLGAIVARIFQ